MLIRVDDKVVGRIENGIYYQTVEPAKHLFGIIDAFGIDFGVFKFSLFKGIGKFTVINKEDNICYETDANTLLEKGIVGNYGYREQVFLPRHLWKPIPESNKK